MLGSSVSGSVHLKASSGSGDWQSIVWRDGVVVDSGAIQHQIEKHNELIDVLRHLICIGAAPPVYELALAETLAQRDELASRLNKRPSE